jgi:hypothetical protein
VALPHLSDYLAAQSFGQFWRGDIGSGEYLSSVSDGVWRNSDPSFYFDGLVYGKASISYLLSRTENIIGSIEGYGVASSNVSGTLNITVVGSVAGRGIILHNYTLLSPSQISGSVAGVGKIGYKLNYSKRKALNPILVAQNYPYNKGDCPIATIEYDGFSPNKIINLISKEDEIYENTIDFHRIETLSKVDGIYPIKHYPYDSQWNNKIKYLVTDFRADNSNGDPLFFQYEPLFDVYAPDSGIAISNIYRNDDTIVKPNEYIVQYNYDLLSDGSGRYTDTQWGNQVKQNNVHRIRVLLPYKCIDDDQYFTIEYNKSSYNTNQYQKELIELQTLYNSNDYSINSTGLIVPPNSKLTRRGPIMIVKDPRYRVAPLDVVSIKGDGYLSDQIATWKLRLNAGSFIRSSGYFNNVTQNIYNLEDKYFQNTYIPITNAKPTIIKPNLLKLKESPIYIDPTLYTYPFYQIDVYDKTNTQLIDQRGKISIDINGITRSDIKIKSIDTKKGYIELDTELDPTDEVELTFFMSPDGSFVVDNLELNPKISGDTNFHISGYPYGLGLAIRPYTDDINGWYPYIYDLKDGQTGTLKNLYKNGNSIDSVTANWNDANFIPLCEISLNKLSIDIVKLTDARKFGGGAEINKELQKWFNTNYSGIMEHENEWYTDYGYYGGAPLSNSSTIIIHIPQHHLTDLENQWIHYYEQEMDNISEARLKGISEYKHYLDQTIRRYLSAGTEYILIPTVSGEFTGKIIDLRQ